MRLLQLVWKDILWLNSLRPAVKIAVLIIGIALIAGAWYLGPEWWSKPTLHKGQYHPRAGVAGAILIIILIVYIINLLDRHRKSG